MNQFTSTTFKLLFEDERLVAINKPTGIMVHRSSITEDKIFILQLLRDQLGQYVYPIHRLDRGTSGVLLFAKDSEMASLMGKQFQELKQQKVYLAIIRGFVAAQETIDYALKSERTAALQNAITNFVRLEEAELDFAVNRYPTSRYSFVEAYPQSGRFHQIRRHFAHIRHPIIGCKKHGDCKHNNYFRDQLGISRMLLHASELSFEHPVSQEKIHIKAEVDQPFAKAKALLFGNVSKA